jgi:peptide/nickel transport system permease protein
MPVFWFGLLLILLFSVQLGWLPTSGIATIGAGFDPLDSVKHLIMPTCVLALVFAGGYTRYLRTSMLEVIRQDFVRTARSKGLAERLVIMRHAFRNALIPVVTLVALDVPELFTGAVVTETIFAWPGMGRLYLESLARLDYSVLMAILTVSALLVIVSNLLADVVYAYLDPRIRYA